MRGGWGRRGKGRGVRRSLAAALAVVLPGSLLAVVPVGLPLTEGPSEAGAQTSASGPILHRTEITASSGYNYTNEGLTQPNGRDFVISEVPDATAYYLRLRRGGTYTLSHDWEVKALIFHEYNPDPPSGTQLGVVFEASSNANAVGTQVKPDKSGRISFELTAIANFRDTGADETLGVQLCSTSTCTDGSVLGEWEVTKKAPAADSTLNGTNASVTVTGGSTTMMERTRNGDARDHRDSIKIAGTHTTTEAVYIVGKVDTQARVRGGKNVAIARVNSGLYTGKGKADGERTVMYLPSGYNLASLASATTRGGNPLNVVTLVAQDNIVDTPGGELSGTLSFRVLKVSDGSVYTGFSLPAVPLTVTHDDEATPVSVVATSNTDAREGTNDEAEVRVSLGRALTAGEALTVPLTFEGATLGTHFTLSLTGSPAGIAYADSSDGTQGRVTFTGPSEQTARIAVAAVSDDGNTASENLAISTVGGTGFEATGLDGGACAGEACSPDTPLTARVSLREPETGPRVVIHDISNVIDESDHTQWIYGVKLSEAPDSGNVTVSVTSDSPAISLGSRRSQTFNADGNGATRWDRQQGIDLVTRDNVDRPDGYVTFTFSVSGSGNYANVPDVTRTVWHIDDDATTVSLSGGGSSAGAATQVMVEGDASTSDTLTVSLSRPLVAGERARVPVRLLGLDNGAQVRTVRGLRVGANVEYPPHFNDITMTATGTGVSYTHVDIKTPPHAGLRWIDFEGAGAQTATVTMTPRSGFDDGETGDEVIEVDLYENLATARAQQFAASGTNLGGGLAAQGAPVRYFGIDDDDGDLGVVPADWPLLPSGLDEGDKFRLLYVTAAKTDANNPHLAYYDTFARSDILGEQFCPALDSHGAESLDACTEPDGDEPPQIALVGAGLGDDGVDALKPYAPSFRAVVGRFLAYRERTDASDHADFGGGGGEAIYWVNGSQAADDNADFRDGSWDDQANPRFADGTLARYDSDSDGTLDSQGPDPDGYWTGSYSAGQVTGTPSGDSTRCIGLGHPGIGSGLGFSPPRPVNRVQVGYLSGSSATLHTPLGPVALANPYNPDPNVNNPHPPQNCAASNPDELRSVYALSGVLIVGAAAQDQAVTVELDAATYEAAEGDSFAVVVSLSAARSVATTVQLASARGTAVPGTDFTAGPYSVTIPAGSTTATATIATTQDSVLEPSDETFALSIAESSLPAGVTAGSVKRARMTIVDDEYTFSFSGTSYQVDERAGEVLMLAVLSRALGSDVDVYFTFRDLTAAAGTDFTAVHGVGDKITIPAGERRVRLRVPIAADTTSSSNKLFYVTPVPEHLPTGHTASASEATVVIRSNSTSDERVDLSLSATTVAEGSAVTLTATLPAAASGADVVVPVVRAADSDAAAADYVLGGATAGTIVVPDGQTQGSIRLTAVADRTAEGRVHQGEELLLLQAGATGLSDGYLPGRVAAADITDTAVVPVNLSVSASGAVTEGGGPLTVTATLAAANDTGSAVAIPIEVRPAGTTAQSGDYTIASSISIPNGQTAGTASFTVNDDSTEEDAETVVVQLGASLPTGYGAAARNLVTVTIADDDTAPVPVVQFRDASLRVFEGAPFEFPYYATIVIEAASAVTEDTVVSFTLGGTAVRGSDYIIPEATSVMSETIPAGETEGQVVLRVLNDDNHEADETIVLTLVDGDGYDLGSQTVHTVTIRDLPDVEFAAATSQGVEGETATVTVRASHAFAVATDVEFTVGGTAKAADYTAPTSPVRFAAGATTATLSIPITADTDSDAGETIILTLVDRNGYDAGKDTRSTTQWKHTITLADPPSVPAVEFSAAVSTAKEGATARVTVETGSAVGADTDVAFTVAGSAQSADFTAPSSPVTIRAGQTSAVIEIPIAKDSPDDSGETIILTLTDGADYDLGSQQTHTVTLAEADPPPDLEFAASVSRGREGATVSVRVDASRAAEAAYAVSYTSTGGTATAGADYTTLSGTFTMPAGAASAAFDVAVAEDSTSDSGETIVLTLTDGADYDLGSRAVHTVTITEVDPPTLVFTQPRVFIAEGGAAQRYGISLSHDPSGSSAALPACDYDPYTADLPRCTASADPVVARVVIASPDVGLLKVFTGGSIVPAGEAVLEFTRRNFADPQFVTVYPEPDDDADSEQNVLIGHSIRGAVDDSAAFRASSPYAAGTTTGGVDDGIALPDMAAYVTDDDAAPGLTVGFVKTAGEKRFETLRVIEEDAGETGFTFDAGTDAGAGEKVAARVRITGGVHGEHYMVKGSGNISVAGPVDDGSRADGAEFIVTFTRPIQLLGVLKIISKDDESRATGGRFLNVELLSAFSPDGSAGVDADPATPDGVGLTLGPQTARVHVLPKDRLIVRQVASGEFAGAGRVEFDGLETDGVKAELTVNDASATIAEGDTTVRHVAVKLSKPPKGTRNVVVTVAVSDPAKLALAGDGDDDGAVTLTFRKTAGSSELTYRGTQTVGFVAKDDADFDDELVDVTVTMASGYGKAHPDGSLVRRFAVRVEDDDAPAGVTVTPGSLTVIEGEKRGAKLPRRTDGRARDHEVAVRLDADPGSGVTVRIEPVLPEGIASSAKTLDFTGGTSGNWQTWQTIGVKARDDDDSDDEELTVTWKRPTVTAGSSAAYSALTAADVASVAVTVLDDDAGVRVSERSVDLVEDATERGGATLAVATYQVVLQRAPAAGETVTVTPVSGDTGAVGFGRNEDGSAVTVHPGVVFTADAWAEPRTVELSPVGDADAADESVTISHTVSTTGSVYSAVSAGPSVRADVLDDDRAAGIVVSSDGEAFSGDGAVLFAHENGDAVGFSVRLAGRPAAELGRFWVDVSGGGGAVVADADPNASGAQTVLPFSQDNWWIPQTVWVTAPDETGGGADAADGLAELSLTAAEVTDSTRAPVGAYGTTPVWVHVYDDEFAGGPTYTVTGSGALIEGLAPAIFTVQGDMVPSSSTDVTLRISETGDFVAAGDEGDQTVTFSTGAVLRHQVPIVDDGTAEPDGTITAALQPGSGYRVGNPSRASIGVTDDGDTGTGAITADLSVSNSGAVTEGGTLTVTVTLGAAATSALSIPVEAAATPSPTASSGDYTLSNSGSVDVAMGATSGTLTFTAADDMIAEDAETLTLELGTLPAGVTAGTAASVAVTITDNDTAGVTVVESGGSTTVSEDPSVTDTYTVRLNSQPLTNVVVRATAPAGVQVDGPAAGRTWLSQLDLTFTPSNWNTPQTVTVRGQNDDIVNAGGKRDVTITQAVQTGDTNGKYTSSTPVANVEVDVTDNDTAGVTVAETSGGTTVSEDGTTTTDAYTVRLTSQPLNNVIVTVTAPAGTQVSTDNRSTWHSSRELTFNPSGSGIWSTTQTVHVRGVNDDIDNANDRRVIDITHGITSGNGDGGGYTTSTTIDAVSVTVTDDSDTAGVTVSKSAMTVSEDQSDSDTYTVRLGSEPLNDVVITATAPDGAQVSTDGGTSWYSSRELTFNPSGSGIWSTTQTVTVRGMQDIIDNPGNRRDVTITHSIAGGNGDGSRYTPSMPSIADVDVRVNDDDPAPTHISLSTNRSTVSEGTASTQVTVTAQVQGAKRFGVAKTVRVSVATTADTTSANYVDMTAVADFDITIPAGAQSHTGTFTIAPDNDMVAEQNNSVAVTGTVTGDSAVTVNPATAIPLTDDDAAPTGITLSASPTSVDEDGGAQSIAVTATVDGATRFGTAQTVAVSVAGHDTAGQVGFTQVTGFSITIPAEAASASESFTLTPDDNVWFESNGEAAISGTSAVTVTGASVTLTNDDAAPSGVTLSVMPMSSTEDGGAQTVTVTATVNGTTRYGTPRTVSVSVAGSSNADAVDFTASTPTAISLAAGQASATTTFTLTPTPDSTDEFDETITVSGSGAGIDAVTAASVTLTDGDDTTVSISAPAGAVAENGGTKDVTLTLSRALVDGETVTVPLDVVGVTAGSGSDYTVALHPASQTGVSLSTSGADSAQQPKVTLTTGAASAVLRFTAVDDSTRTQPYALVRYGTGARTPSGSGVDFTAPTDGPVGWVITDDETGDIVVPQSWALAPSGVQNQGEPRFRLVFASSAERDASSTAIADYDAFIRGLLAEGHAAVVPYAGFFTVLGSTSGVHLRDHASVTGSATMPFYWLGETGDATKRVATSNSQLRGEWIDSETPSSQSVPRDESGTVVSVDANGYFTGSTAAGARSSNPLGSTNVTVGYLNDSGSGRAPLGSGQTAASTATRSFYGLSPTFVRATDPVISVSTSQTSVVEGTTLSFTVTASPAPSKPLTVRLWVLESAGRDMVADGEQMVTFAAGDASRTHTVATAGDNSDEADSEVSLRVLNSAGYTVSTTAEAATVTVTDDDATAVAVSGGGGTVNEGASKDYTVNPGRGLASGESVTVNFAPAGSATQGSDYSITCHGSGVSCAGLGGTTPVLTITGGSGVRNAVIRVSALADSAHPETGETAGISLRSGHASTGSGGAFAVSGTPSTFAIASTAPAALTASFGAATYQATEAAGSRTVTVPVSLSAAAPSGGLSVSYSVSGTATAADRSTPSGTSGTVSFAQGASSASITVTVVDDVLAEGSETIVLTITDGAGYDPGTTAKTTITVADNDAAPTNVVLSVDDDSVGEGDGATTITVTATVQGVTRFADAKTVAVTVTGSGGANVVGFTANPSTFNIAIAAGAQTGTNTFVLTPTDNGTQETDETVTVAGVLSGVTVASETITVTDDDTAAATPVTVTLSAPVGDVTEGAGGAAGRKDLTVTLGRALTGSETVTVPLHVQGATVGSDYSFGLHPATQNGVTLLASNPYSAQHPAVQFSAGASSAVLRFVPVDNGVRTQPLVTINRNSAHQATAGGGATLGTVTGGPFKFMVVDDETGDIVVPSSWGLAPSGLGAGDDFRLLFRTSTTRDATSADIADYDFFVRNVLALAGHSDAVPYAGFFKAFASTRSGSGSTGTTARVHNGMASGHTGHFSGAGDVWADGSTVPNAGNAKGTPVYWLNGAILANNYADLCDQALKSGNGVTTGWDIDDPRSETGSRNIASGVTAGQAHQAWTGTGNACEAYDYPLGNSGNVSRAASHDTTWAFMHEGHSANTQQRPLYGMSPVFKIAGTAVVPVADFVSASSAAAESAGTRSVAVRLVPAPSQSVTVAYTLSGTAARGSDYTISGVTSNSGTVTVGTSGMATIPVAITDDSTPESAETVVLTISGSGSGYTVGTTAPTHTLTITDNDTTGMPRVSVTAGPAVNEGGNAVFTIAASPVPAGAITVRYTVAQNGQFVSSGRLGSGKQRSLSGASATIAIPTVNDSTDEADGSVTVTVTGGFNLGYTVGQPASATVTVRDNDVPAARFAAAVSDADESSGTHLVRVNLSPAPHRGTTVSYTVGGTATRGADFATPGTVSVPAGAAFVDIPVTIIGDSAAEPDETVVLTLTGGAGYRVGSPSAHTVTVADGPAGPPAALPVVTVTAGSRVFEGGADAVFKLSASLPVAGVPVRYTVAQNGEYVASGQLGSGKTQTLTGTGAAIRVPIVNDSVDEASGSVTVTLEAGSGYTVGSPASATVAVFDEDRSVARFAAAASAAGEGSGTHHVRVLFSTAPYRDHFLNYSVLSSREPGSATRGVDFTTAPGVSIFVRAGATYADIPVGIVDDNIAEGPETVTLRLNIGRYYFLDPSAGRTHTLTITDSGTAATPVADFAVAASAAAESAGTRNVEVRLVPAPAQATTVSYALSGTAARGSDYTISGVTSNTGTVTVGTSGTATIPVAIVDDAAAEGAETVVLTLSGGAGYTVGADSPSHTLTIAANDAPVVPQLRVAAGSAVDEGTAATFTVWASPAATGTVTVRYTVAQNGQFVASGRLGSGKTQTLSGASAAISIPTQNDSTDEADGSVTVTLETAGGYTVGSPSAATVTVRDDDVPAAQFAAASSTASESAGTRNVTVRLVPAPAQSTTVSYTLSGTAVRGSDYTISGVTSNTGTVVVGTSGTATIPVAITDDSSAESAETVTLTLNGGAGYDLGNVNRSHTLTITDNDTVGVPQVTVAAGAAVDEGGNAVFTVSANPAPTGTISVRYTVTQNGQFVSSGRLGSNKSRTLSGASATIAIPTVADSTDEADGSVTVMLTAGSGYTVGTPSAATVTVRDDDVPTAQFATASASADESSGIRQVRVNLSPAPHRGITVRYTLGGSATRGTDYTAAGSASAAAGAAFVDIPVTVIDDTGQEPDETVILTLTGGAGYQVGSRSTHTLTITDQDVSPAAAFATAAEQASESTGTHRVTLTVQPAPTAPITVRYTVGGSATRGADYTAPSGTVTVAANATTAAIDIPITHDTANEGDETVVLTLSAPGGSAGYVLGGQSSYTLTILDDDATPTTPRVRFNSSAIRVPEHRPGIYPTVYLDPWPSSDVTIHFAIDTNASTATLNEDYRLYRQLRDPDGDGVYHGTFIADAGNFRRWAKLSVQFIQDGVREGDETIVIYLLNGPGYTLGDMPTDTITITITD